MRVSKTKKTLKMKGQTDLHAVRGVDDAYDRCYVSQSAQTTIFTVDIFLDRSTTIVLPQLRWL